MAAILLRVVSVRFILGQGFLDRAMKKVVQVCHSLSYRPAEDVLFVDIVVPYFLSNVRWTHGALQ